MTYRAGLGLLALGLTWACARSHALQGGELAAGGAASPPVQSGQLPRVAPVSAAPGDAPAREPLYELRLVRALPIEHWGNFQPSGLLWQAGKLLTVSDKHDSGIFELIIEDELARVRLHQQLQKPAGVDELDLEGLCDDGAGGLLLASEHSTRVLRVDAGGTVSWYTPSLKELGAHVGLFQLSNAGLEGVARLGDGALLLATERSERGLIELPSGNAVQDATAWSLPTTHFALSGDRKPDFSDLAVSGDAVYALVRNGHLVTRLVREAAGWREDGAWSFAQTENDPRYAYRDRRYGIAEGLAFDDNFVYIVVDNNGDGRVQDPRDIRPQLFVFDRPLD